jgi:hypothetical protein
LVLLFSFGELAQSFDPRFAIGLTVAWSFSQKSFNQGKSFAESQYDQIGKKIAICAKGF